jgi:hypothetical protein
MCMGMPDSHLFNTCRFLFASFGLLSGSLASAVTRVPGTNVYYTANTDPITDINIGAAFIGEQYDQETQTLLIVKCADRDRSAPWINIHTKNVLLTSSEADANIFPNVVVRLGTDTPIQVAATNLASIVHSDGTVNVNNIGFSEGLTRTMVTGLLANKKLVIRITRTTGGAPLTYTFPATGFSTAWTGINQCRSAGPASPAVSAPSSAPAALNPAGSSSSGSAAGAPKFIQWGFTGCTSQSGTTAALIAGQGSACGLSLDFVPNGAAAISAEFRYELEYLENGVKGKLTLDGVDRWSVSGGGKINAQVFANRLTFQLPLNVRLRPNRRYTSINVIGSIVFDNGSSKRIYEPLTIVQP